MKQAKASGKKRKKINEKHLAAYTAAASAALLTAVPADAAIQYSGAVDISVSTVDMWSSYSFHSEGGNSHLFDIDGDGIDDLNFWNSAAFLSKWVDPWACPYAGCQVGSWYVNGGFSNLNGVSFAGAAGIPSNLDAGAIINAANSWIYNTGNLLFGNMQVAHSTSGTFGWVNDSVSGGNFTLGNPGYLGIRFDPGDGTKYGWIHIAVVERVDYFGFVHAESRYSYTIDGWAYDDSGQAIMAGQTVVPEPTSIALFAAGAATIMAKRRRKKKSLRTQRGE